MVFIESQSPDATSELTSVQLASVTLCGLSLIVSFILSDNMKHRIYSTCLWILNPL